MAKYTYMIMIMINLYCLCIELIQKKNMVINTKLFALYDITTYPHDSGIGLFRCEQFF